jgi:hypothetical protein
MTFNDIDPLQMEQIKEDAKQEWIEEQEAIKRDKLAEKELNVD